MTEESNIIKKIWRNNTREKEIIQALEKNDGLAWEEDGMAYMEGRIYVSNNKKLREEILRENITIQQILDIQDNTECWNYSRGLTGGWDSKRISRNTYKDISNINKIKSSINKEQVNYIH